MRILIVTDAAHPQVNGVVTTLTNISDQLKMMGHAVVWLEPSMFHTVALPLYPEIRVAIDLWNVGKAINASRADAIHIATPEGPIGLAAKLYCDRKKIRYTTSYHTKFPEYINKRLPFIPLSFVYRFARWVHGGAVRTLVTTNSMKAELTNKSFRNLVVWSRGVDLDLFHPDARPEWANHELPILLYVGRVSVEKNLEAFLSLDIPYKQMVVVGDGPDRKKLERKYPHVRFVGYKHGIELAKWFAAAKVFVFPSKTDTFGLVLLEANACGTPFAAFPVPGPKDVVDYVGFANGFVSEDLENAITMASLCTREEVREYVENNYSWKMCAEQFLENIIPIPENKNEPIQKNRLDNEK